MTQHKQKRPSTQTIIGWWSVLICGMTMTTLLVKTERRLKVINDAVEIEMALIQDSNNPQGTETVPNEDVRETMPHILRHTRK